MKIRCISYWLAGLFFISQSLFGVIFEADDRKNLYEFAPHSMAHTVSRSVALVTSRKNILPRFDGFSIFTRHSIENGIDRLLDWGVDEVIMLSTRTFAEAQAIIGEKLCTDERFYNDPTPFELNKAGTGFLVGTDILVTAGHVVENEKDCESLAFVFGYGYSTTHRDSIRLLRKDVYTCRKILYSRNNLQEDFSVIQLDRPVEGRKVLSLRTRTEENSLISEKAQHSKRLWMVGHPLGVPAKVTENGKLRMENKAQNYFYSTLDTYAGNSGSPVLDSETSLVEGILVEGELGDTTLRGDYPEGCWYSKVYCDEENKTKYPCDEINWRGAKSTSIQNVLPYVPVK